VHVVAGAPYDCLVVADSAVQNAVEACVVVVVVCFVIVARYAHVVMLFCFVDCNAAIGFDCLRWRASPVVTLDHRLGR
jgi:hypothetical protein